MCFFVPPQESDDGGAQEEKEEEEEEEGRQGWGDVMEVAEGERAESRAITKSVASKLPSQHSKVGLSSAGGHLAAIATVESKYSSIGMLIITSYCDCNFFQYFAFPFAL